MYLPPLIYRATPISGHLGCFGLLAVVNSAAVNAGVQIPAQVSALRYCRCIPRGEIAEP